MAAPVDRKYFIVSAVTHVAVLLILILSVDFSAPLAVFENTDKHDVISAVVLGDTEKSKMILDTPKPKPVPPPVKEVVKEEPAPPKPAIAKSAQPEPDVIALKAAEKKKLADQKALEDKKRQEMFGKDLLADIKKVADKKKEAKQKELKADFQKLLKAQSEQSLRQQLLNEDIKIDGKQARYAQGEVNKYKALILQSISEHWVVPTQANRKLTCELMIRVAPGGTVLDVQVTKSSGDVSLDRSAKAAVLKSSPLPVPKEGSAFEPFRQFALKVKPENVLTNNAL